ncbi:MAG: hypothetical protein Q9160_004588 [Pyrenula sp. 1 TL-2023]
MHKSVNFDELIALYSVSDVCLVTSTRDGMNLVSYEYIATQSKRHGVLVLSEFTGAAQSLNGSIIVNPWNTEELANAMQEAVTMSDEQRAINFTKLHRYVSKYTSAFWGQSFVAELTRISEHGERKLKLRRETMKRAEQKSAQQHASEQNQKAQEPPGGASLEGETRTTENREITRTEIKPPHSENIQREDQDSHVEKVTGT